MRLCVRDFSCIRHAEIDFKRLTVLIGPQASGKSILAKLNYFCLSIVHRPMQYFAQMEDYSTFQETVKADFIRWFAPNTWGSERFEISFSAGSFGIHITRRKYKDKLHDAFNLSISSEFKQVYERAYTMSTSKLKEVQDLRSRQEYDLYISLMREFDKGMSEVLGSEQIQSQIFIPAGRSFFTSMGKAFTAFEQSAVLDPLLLQFGRMFANFTDGRRFWLEEGKPKAVVKQLNSEMLGGEVVLSRDINYVQMRDGRKIPFSTLSSGQQELLPLLLTLENYVADRGPATRSYIEEPEAHLFPEAQCRLLELFAILLNSSKSSSMVITTHSPYVPAKLNNLIRAGQIGSIELYKGKVAEVIKPDRWLLSEEVSSYAICEGDLKNIIDEDGLIDAGYIDSVSNSISNEFSRLLEIEFGTTKKI